jgi:hypothetical protein
MLKLAPPRPRKERAVSTGAPGLDQRTIGILPARPCSIVSKMSEMLTWRGERYSFVVNLLRRAWCRLSLECESRRHCRCELHPGLTAEPRWTKPLLVVAGEGPPPTSSLDARGTLLRASLLAMIAHMFRRLAANQRSARPATQ